MARPSEMNVRPEKPVLDAMKMGIIGTSLIHWVKGR
jgi:hypothetical protein